MTETLFLHRLNCTIATNERGMQTEEETEAAVVEEEDDSEEASEEDLEDDLVENEKL